MRAYEEIGDRLMKIRKIVVYFFLLSLVSLYFSQNSYSEEGFISRTAANTVINNTTINLPSKVSQNFSSLLPQAMIKEQLFCGGRTLELTFPTIYLGKIKVQNDDDTVSYFGALLTNYQTTLPGLAYLSEKEWYGYKPQICTSFEAESFKDMRPQQWNCVGYKILDYNSRRDFDLSMILVNEKIHDEIDVRLTQLEYNCILPPKKHLIHPSVELYIIRTNNMNFRVDELMKKNEINITNEQIFSIGFPLVYLRKSRVSYGNDQVIEAWSYGHFFDTDVIGKEDNLHIAYIHNTDAIGGGGFIFSKTGNLLGINFATFYDPGKLLKARKKEPHKFNEYKYYLATLAVSSYRIIYEFSEEISMIDSEHRNKLKAGIESCENHPIIKGTLEAALAKLQ